MIGVVIFSNAVISATRTAMLDMAPGENHIFRRIGDVVYYGYRYFHNSPYYKRFCPVLGVDLNDTKWVKNVYGLLVKDMLHWNNEHYILISNWPLNYVEVLGIVVGITEQKSGKEFKLWLDDSSGSYIECRVPKSVYEKLDLDADCDLNYGRFLQLKGRVLSWIIDIDRRWRVDVFIISPLVVGSEVFPQLYQWWQRALKFRQRKLASPWDFSPPGRSPGCAFDGGHDYDEITNQLPRSDDSVILTRVKQQKHGQDDRLSASQPSLSKGSLQISPQTSDKNGAVVATSITTLPKALTAICEVIASNRFERMTLGTLFCHPSIVSVVKQYTNHLRRDQHLHQLRELTYKSIFRQLCRNLIDSGVLIREEEASRNRTWVNPDRLRLIYTVMLSQLRKGSLLVTDTMKLFHDSDVTISGPLFNGLVKAVIRRYNLGHFRLREDKWQRKMLN